MRILKPVGVVILVFISASCATSDVVPEVKTREPLPMFHPEFLHHLPSARTVVEAERNVQNLALLARKIDRVEIRAQTFLGDEPYSRTYSDPQLVADIQWAFSGNLTECGWVTQYGFDEVIFHLTDGQQVRVLPLTSWIAIDFPGATFTAFAWTEQMYEVLEPIRNDFRQAFFDRSGG